MSWVFERFLGVIKNVGRYFLLEICEKKDVYIFDKLIVYVVYMFKVVFVEIMFELFDIIGSSVYVIILVLYYGWLGEWEGEGGGDVLIWVR